MQDRAELKSMAFNIRKYRKMLGMGQKELADLLNVTPTCISNWECGFSFPRPWHIMKMCEVFGVCPNDLFFVAGSHRELDLTLNEQENNFLKMYRALDERGQEHIDVVLDALLRHHQRA